MKRFFEDKVALVTGRLLITLFVFFAATSVRAETMNTDVVVIGAGATGLTAALTAAEGGAKVILFEKQSYPGGNAMFTEGLFAVETSMQRENYIGITRDEVFKNVMEYSHWRANPRLVRAFVDESASTVEWLQKEGVEFVGPVNMFPDGPRVWHILKGPNVHRAAGMVKILVARAKEKGVDFRLATPVKKIIKEGGKVTGVIAESNGKEIQVTAKAVIIGTGGYANNKEWIKKYTGFDVGENLFVIASAYKTGDGIRMAWDAGAAEEGINTVMLARIPRGFNEYGRTLETAGVQPDLYVNQQGERYCDESIQFIFPSDANALARLKEKYSYTIFDDAAKREMIEEGVVTGIGMIVPPGTKLTKLDADLKDALENKSHDVFAAGSVEALATKMGINPSALKATVDEYNRFCAQGHDPLFAKDRRFLRPLKGPKFYAVKMYSAAFCTLGGIKINHKMEVVDKEERAIPGLYAGGNDAGGVYGDSYDVSWTTGGALSFALSSGRIAARSALTYMGK
jgi:fumarate reductase flavoprotein subunit